LLGGFVPSAFLVSDFLANRNPYFAHRQNDQSVSKRRRGDGESRVDDRYGDAEKDRGLRPAVARTEKAATTGERSGM